MVGSCSQRFDLYPLVPLVSSIGPGGLRLALIRALSRLSVLLLLFGSFWRRGPRHLVLQQGGSAFESGQALRNHCPDCRAVFEHTGPPEAVERFLLPFPTGPTGYCRGSFGGDHMSQDGGLCEFHPKCYEGGDDHISSLTCFPRASVLRVIQLLRLFVGGVTQ